MIELRYTKPLPTLRCWSAPPEPHVREAWKREHFRPEPPRPAPVADPARGAIVADWEGVVVNGRLYSVQGAEALEHVRRGAGPEQLAELMGQPGHRGWMAMHAHYARHIAEGPVAGISGSSAGGTQ